VFFASESETMPSENKALVAVDLGAQSCRVSLLRFDRGHPHVDIVHRFGNGPIVTPTAVRWDIGAILDGVQTGLRLCAGIATEGIAAIGVDGWAVDYVRLDQDGNQIANPFCYRDERTIFAEREVHQILSPAKLYSLTGIQLLRINTLYQLYADERAGIEPAKRWLNLPEFITYRLGARPVSEYTNATHTQLVDLMSKRWCEEIFQATGLEQTAAPEIVPTGTIVGGVRGDLSELTAFRQTRLIAPACHDTASAIAAIPASGDDWAFISSGTWSLVGAVLDKPCAGEDARAMNFTNLGGVGGTVCFLKNVNGMWLLRQCMDEWESRGTPWRLGELLEQCALLPAPGELIDVDDPELMLPGNMLGKISVRLQRRGAAASSDPSPPVVANAILHSLAARYAEVLEAVARISAKELRRLFVVGGGSQNWLLNRLTAERTGLEVVAGATEGTTIGNFAIQMAALAGDWNDASGVAAASVAKYVERISVGSLALGAAHQH
jgi:rhamnulokinase